MTFSKSEKNRLKEKYGPWAIVTGASSGIGLELAERLAEAGLNLVLNSRNQEDLERVGHRFQSQHGIETRLVAADLSQPAGIAQILAAVDGLPVGLLAAAAGFGTSGPFLKSSLETEVNLLEVNCIALLKLAHHYGRQFAANQRGGIILMSSLVSFQGVPLAANYAASKAYVQSLAEALAVELRPHGVDVLAAAPGPVESGFGRRANMQMNLALKPSQVGIPILKALGRRQTVLPGLLTKFLVGSLRTLPRWGKVRVMKIVMGGMTGGS